MITFFKSQEDLADTLKKIIDDYWNLEIREEDLIETIKKIVENNKEIIYKDNDYTAIVKQRLGTKRITLIEKIIKIEKEER